MLITHKTSVHSRANKRDIQDKSATESTIYLYGDIGGWFGVDHQEWIKEFNAIKSDTIHVRVDSSGGDIFAARAMKTAVMQHKAKVIGHVDGLAASAASFFIMGCDEIEIVDGGFLMVHKAMSMIDILGYFNEDDLSELCEDMQKEMQLHGKINEAIANDYAKKTKKKSTECLGWMNDETWFTAKEALESGLVDRIYDGDTVEGSYDLSIYAKVPEALKNRNQAPSKRAIEKALRDSGLSNKQAKDILMKGYQKDKEDDQHRDDVDPQPGVVQIPDPIIPDQPIVDHQEDDPIPVKKKDRIADLLCRAEIIAPST